MLYCTKDYTAALIGMAWLSIELASIHGKMAKKICKSLPFCGCYRELCSILGNYSGKYGDR